MPRERRVVRTDIAALCHELAAIPSVSHQEQRIADFVAERLSRIGRLKVSRIGNNVLAQSLAGRPGPIVIAGHLDTVPADGNETPTYRDGRIYGLGTADMKSGLAVMIALAEKATEFSFDTTFVFYAREEVAAKFSGLLEVDRERPELLRGTAAILMEPTSARIEAGCQGTMRVSYTIKGKRAHTARPWMGVNAIHRMAQVIDAFAETKLEHPIVDGLEFRESLQVVKVFGGVANNVVPDLATLIVNYRFAPNKDVASAFEALRSMSTDKLDDADDVEIEEGVDGALPNLDNAFIAKLKVASAQPVSAKLGWTDVSFFHSRGVAAANFGPGDPLLAHTRDEYVEIAELDTAFNSMRLALT